mmetsp:Transcript_2661/g.6402  ORF Transcript_2661/g.6402 Transcript_2661/m.6402 type:complete len:163 (+) Transcript_2661:107-595(+)
MSWNSKGIGFQDGTDLSSREPMGSGGDSDDLRRTPHHRTEMVETQDAGSVTSGIDCLLDHASAWEKKLTCNGHLHSGQLLPKRFPSEPKPELHLKLECKNSQSRRRLDKGLSGSRSASKESSASLSGLAGGFLRTISSPPAADTHSYDSIATTLAPSLVTGT